MLSELRTWRSELDGELRSLENKLSQERENKERLELRDRILNKVIRGYSRNEEIVENLHEQQRNVKDRIAETNNLIQTLKVEYEIRSTILTPLLEEIQNEIDRYEED